MNKVVKLVGGGSVISSDAEVKLLPDDLRLFFGKSWLTLAIFWLLHGYSWLILSTLGKSWLFSG